MKSSIRIKGAIFDMDGTIYLGGIPFDFAKRFIKNLRRRLKPLGNFDYRSSQSMIYAEPLDDNIDMDEAFSRAAKVFGANAVCRAIITEKEDFAVGQQL